MAEAIRWGILATGNIAHQFARGLQTTPDARLVAVGSRSQESVDRFGDEFNVPRRHASYEALANDPDVDAVYISTPHHLHADNTLMCLNAGKAVLCEKPFALNAAQADQMIGLARGKRLFLMEAMWTRFLPVMVEIRRLLREGVIGEPRMLVADFGFRADFDPRSRIFDPALGGGALLDVGIYPIALSFMVFGAPKQIQSIGHLGQTGVDEQNALLFGYENGKMALLSSASRVATPHEAFIAGTHGTIKIPRSWWMARHFVLSLNGKADEVIEPPFEGNGYNYEAAEVVRCMQAGQTESEVLPLDETRAMMGVMDTIRAQWGMKYPGE